MPMFDLFEEFMDFLEVEEGAAENTLRLRKRDLKRFSDWVSDEHGATDASEVGKRDVIRYVNHLADEGYAPNTTMAAYTSISAAYNHLYREQFIEDNPVERIRQANIKSKAENALSNRERKEQGTKEYLTKEQVYGLAENAPDPNDRNELIIKLMFWTGVRPSELLQIQIGSDGTLDGPGSDINPQNHEIHIYSTKTDDDRWVSYPRSEINPLLRDWVGHGRLRYKCADEKDELFIAPRGALTYSGLKWVIDKAADNVGGIQKVVREAVDGKEYHKVTPHILRHSHAMHYHNKEDVPLDFIKDHLGHHSVDTTEEYYAEATREKMRDTFNG
jgi:site-specific recombinase XerD